MARQKLAGLLGSGEFNEDPELPDEFNNVTVTEEDEVEEPPKAGNARRRQTTKPRKAPKVANVMTDDWAYEAVKKHVQIQKSRRIITTIGKATLQAIERQRDKLAVAWTDPVSETSEPESSGSDLFGIVEEKAPPKKVTWQLYGATSAQIAILDKLGDQWSAPSRSALVQEAIRLDMVAKGTKTGRVTAAATR
ncbi:Uncharacterised protein [Mycobacteroides abscessus subsp. bolletii]|uniref:hypothetical protein n=1 Tax=Mycobacteroides abscessus TaxID=36809 RepID=UPI0009A5A667|nr:hypothetical protein [Mycobacteroides abscessus]SKY99417.1 Uncharacterised protein [Mycobacteroides abscessus subsp. bolletii]